MKKGDIFLLDRWNDGNKKEYKVQRVCRRHVNVNSLDGTEKICLPNNRLKECELKFNP